MRTSLGDRLDGLANPLLVKEMYQSLHSKRFQAFLWLLLLGALFTYIIVYLNRSPNQGCGDTMFVVFSVLAYLVALGALPYLAFSNLQEDIRGRTIELVSITRLDAAKQIRGRLLATGAKLGLLYAVIGPFAVAAFLFRDVGIGGILASLYVVLILAVPAASLGVFFAALTGVTHMRTLAKWIYLILLVMTVFNVGTYGAMTGALLGAMGPGLDELLIGLGVATIGSVLVSWFLCSASANILTFEANKSSAGTKRILLIMILAAFATFFAVSAYVGDYDDDVLMVPVVLAPIALAVCSMVWLTDRKRVPFRVQEKLQHRGALRRLPAFPFTDGMGASTAFFLLASVLIFLGSAIGAAACPGSEDHLYTPLMFLFTYTLYFSALAHFTVRFLPQARRTPKARRGSPGTCAQKGA